MNTDGGMVTFHLMRICLGWQTKYAQMGYERETKGWYWCPGGEFLPEGALVIEKEDRIGVLVVINENGIDNEVGWSDNWNGLIYDSEEQGWNEVDEAREAGYDAHLSLLIRLHDPALVSDAHASQVGESE